MQHIALFLLASGFTQNLTGLYRHKPFSKQPNLKALEACNAIFCYMPKPKFYSNVGQELLHVLQRAIVRSCKEQNACCLQKTMK